MSIIDEETYRQRLKTWVGFLENLQGLGQQAIPADLREAAPYTQVETKEGAVYYGYNFPHYEFGHLYDWRRCVVGKVAIPAHLRKIAEGKD